MWDFLFINGKKFNREKRNVVPSVKSLVSIKGRNWMAYNVVEKDQISVAFFS